MKITSDILKQIGAKHISAPKTRSDKYAKKCDDAPQLVCIVHTPFGEHFKEVYAQSVLQEILSTPLASDFYELNAQSLNKLRELNKSHDVAELLGEEV